MKRPLLAAAAALLVVVNGWVLAGVARNRLGAPDATLALTERELLVTGSWTEEDSSVEAALQVSHWRPGMKLSDPWGWEGWLEGPKLAAFGFDLALPQDETAARRAARRQPARRGWAVLELDGPTWRALEAAWRARLAELEREAAGLQPTPDNLREVAERADRITRARHELSRGTRLFVVDAGPDPEALRAAYPDRSHHLLLPAEIHVELSMDGRDLRCEPARCRLRGRVSLLTESVQVARHLQPAAARRRGRWGGVQDPDGQRAPFSATLVSGARREPWLEALDFGPPPGGGRPAGP